MKTFVTARREEAKERKRLFNKEIPNVFRLAEKVCSRVRVIKE